MNEEGRPIEWHTWRGKVAGRETTAGNKIPHGVWYRALRGAGIRPRGPYHTRHTFISIALSNGANIKWLAEYCGTSVAMIEKHYGKYIRNDVDEQLQRVLGGQSARPVHDFGESEEVSERLGEIGGPTWIRTLSVRTLLHTRKSREVAEKNEQLCNFSARDYLPKMSLAWSLLDPNNRDRLGSRLYISIAKGDGNLDYMQGADEGVRFVEIRSKKCTRRGLPPLFTKIKSSRISGLISGACEWSELLTYAWQAQKAPEKMKKTLINQPRHSSPFPTFPAKSEKFFTSVRPNVLCLQSRASLYDNILIDEI